MKAGLKEAAVYTHSRGGGIINGAPLDELGNIPVTPWIFMCSRQHRVAVIFCS